MKLKRPILFSALLLATMLACSTITNIGTSQVEPTPVKVIFEESEFTDACSFDSNADVERFMENGQYMLKIITPSYVGWAECTDVEYADFVVEVDASQVSGPNNNAYGLILRYGLDSDEFYAFIISGDGYYAFTVDGANRTDPEFLADWAESSAIKQGNQTNRLKVVAVGPSMKYYVNDQILGEVQDSRFTQGTVGFFAGSVDDGNVQIAFDNLRVSEP